MINHPHATVLSASVTSTLWNVYDGPVRVAVLEERHTDKGQAHPIQIVRGQCDHSVAVALIEQAKASRPQRALKGGID